MQPECIVLDEPTAMLDPQGRKEVTDTIRFLNREYGITIILITHYMDEAVLADRVIVMDKGSILTQGNPSEVFSQAELLREHSLDIPQSAQLIHMLKKNGIKTDTLPLKPDECIRLLEEMLAGTDFRLC